MFSEWYEKRNKPIPERAVRWGELTELERLLVKGISYTDYPKAPVPELGYALGLWNGNQRRQGAEITIFCGGFGKYVDNHVVLGVLESEDGIPPLPFLVDALEALVSAWVPDTGEVFQLVPKGEDLNELRCAGYSSKPLTHREGVQIRTLGRGNIWFDEAAYEGFV